MLRGKIVYLRGLEETDLDALHEWMNDFDTIRNLLRIVPSVRTLTRKWYESLMTDRRRVIFAIARVRGGKFIGCTGLNDIDSINQKAKFYIYIGDRRARGKGAACEASKLLLDYAFRYLNLNKIWLQVVEDNTPAIRLYRKLGLRTEGRFPQDVFLDGRYHALLQMYLLRRHFLT
jgi:RimJ/RimL family protein N-acetyltransferase